MVSPDAIDSPPSVECLANDRPSSDWKVKRERVAPGCSLMSPVVRRLQILHTQRTDAVLLDDRFLGGPGRKGLQETNRLDHGSLIGAPEGRRSVTTAPWSGSLSMLMVPPCR